MKTPEAVRKLKQKNKKIAMEAVAVASELGLARCRLEWSEYALAEAKKNLADIAALNEMQSQEIKSLRREVEMLRSERSGVVLRQVGEKVMVVKQ